MECPACFVPCFLVDMWSLWRNTNTWEVEMPFALTVIYTEKAVLVGESVASLTSREDCSEGFLLVPRANSSPGCLHPCPGCLVHVGILGPFLNRRREVRLDSISVVSGVKGAGCLSQQASCSYPFFSSVPADPVVWQPPGKTVLENTERLLF